MAKKRTKKKVVKKKAVEQPVKSPQDRFRDAWMNLPRPERDRLRSLTTIEGRLRYGLTQAERSEASGLIERYSK